MAALHGIPDAFICCCVAVAMIAFRRSARAVARGLRCHVSYVLHVSKQKKKMNSVYEMNKRELILLLGFLQELQQ